MIQYCKRCVLPNTRPGLDFLENGVCIACDAHKQRESIDWPSREKAFTQLVEESKAKARGYECLVPVSGGKDSIWQVRKCLEYGLKTLAVTWRPAIRTAIGEKNLQCLIGLGVDHIDYTINPHVMKKLYLASLQRHGTLGTPMHLAMFNIAHTIAAKFHIPLVIWGENPATEYGGTEAERSGVMVTEELMRRRSISFGTSAMDWVGPDLSAQDLLPFTSPPAEDFKDIFSVFLGRFFPWDPETSLNSALQAGFSVLEKAKLGYYNYADLDDDFIDVHQWIKWYRFGFTRLFDHLALEIRNGRMDRDRALEVIRKCGDQRPDKEIGLFCDFVGISRDAFFDIAERFRNREIWRKDNGVWKIENFIIDDWDWRRHAAAR